MPSEGVIDILSKNKNHSKNKNSNNWLFLHYGI